MFELDYVQTVGVKSFAMTRREPYFRDGYYTIRELPTGESFKLIGRSKKIYIRGSYNGKGYDAQAIDTGRLYSVKGTLKVHAGFPY